MWTITLTSLSVLFYRRATWRTGAMGFPLRGRPEVLVLHIDVWAADRGRTDLTVEFDLTPEADGYRVELHDMHVM